jgi:signal transduction histidine kinase
MTRPSVEDLRAIDLFDDLDDAQLARWAEAAVLEDLRQGALIVEQGAESPGLTLLLAGTIELFFRDGDRLEPGGDQLAPTWIGAISTLTEGPSAIRMEAKTDVRMATVPPDAFWELVQAHRAVFRRVMAAVRPVVGRIAAIEQNRERLASLGTMAAGLAHELNNPAAAAKRASAELAEALAVLGSTIGVFVESGVEREEAASLVAMQRAALATAEAQHQRSALDAADAEDEVAAALQDAGVPDGWRLAEPLARAGVDAAFLARVRELAGPATDAAVRWMAASLVARDLARELAESTDRMSRLVSAVKGYAYMDRGSLVEVDVREGLETTLVILGHKLKHTTIEVVRDYDPDVPPFLAHGAELNQVWTNLLDNAIDALGRSGTIAVSTRLDGACVEVAIADNGPGIPDDVRDRIFDPFFTTKDVGHGTGLGLDTARRIVVVRHRGSLRVESAPGRTVFTARLPLVPEASPTPP